MKKKMGLILMALLALTFIGCSKPAKPAEESQSTTEQGTQPAAASTESAGGDQAGKTDYTNQALLEAAVKEIFTRAENLEGIQYENVIAFQGVETIQKIWQAKDNMKISTSVGGTESVTIITKELTVTYDAATKQGVSFSNQTKVEQSEMPAIDKENLSVLKFIAEEDLNGEPCIVVMSTAVGSESAKFWLSKNYGIIMKSEVVDSNSNTTMTLTVKNLKTFKPESNFFEVPKDINIIKM